MTDRPAVPETALPAPAPASPARRLAELAMATLTGLVAAHLLWLLVAPESRLPAPETQRQTAATTAVKAQNPADFGIFSRFDPFSRSIGAAPAASETAAPETSLDLKLFGVRLGADPAHSSAIIQTGGGAQAVFRPGDEILSGVRLDRVHENRVSLSRSGVLESLSLDEDTGPILGGRNDRPAAPAAPAGPAVAANDLASLLRQIRLVPRRDGQRITGWQVEAGGNTASAAALKALGLEPGDILATLNGAALTSAEDLMDALSDIDRAGPVALEIDRAGKRVPLTLRPESNPA